MSGTIFDLKLDEISHLALLLILLINSGIGLDMIIKGSIQSNAYASILAIIIVLSGIGLLIGIGSSLTIIYKTITEGCKKCDNTFIIMACLLIIVASAINIAIYEENKNTNLSTYDKNQEYLTIALGALSVVIIMVLLIFYIKNRKKAPVAVKSP